MEGRNGGMGGGTGRPEGVDWKSGYEIERRTRGTCKLGAGREPGHFSRGIGLWEMNSGGKEREEGEQQLRVIFFMREKLFGRECKDSIVRHLLLFDKSEQSAGKDEHMRKKKQYQKAKKATPGRSSSGSWTTLRSGRRGPRAALWYGHHGAGMSQTHRTGSQLLQLLPKSPDSVGPIPFV